MNCNRFSAVLILAFLSFSTVAVADDGFLQQGNVQTNQSQSYIDGRLSAEVYGGYLQGVAKEIVYDVPAAGQKGPKISELDWQIDNAAIAGGRVAYAALPWLNIRANAWTKVDSDNAIDDYDWLAGYNGKSSWSDWSHHDDTDLIHAYNTDISTSSRLFATGGTTITGLLGYRYENYKWKVRGGSYTYSTSGTLRDAIGTFPNGELVGSYQQSWHIPYAGLGFAQKFGGWKVSGEAIGTPFAIVHDEDNHYLTTTNYKDNFSRSNMVGVSGGMEYSLTKHISLTGNAEYQNMFEAKGKVKATDTDTGAVAYAPKPTSGASLETYTVRAGLKYTFH